MPITVGRDTAKTRRSLRIGEHSISYYSIPAATEAGLGDFSRRPTARKVVLENMLQFEDGGFFPIDDETLRHLRNTGRDEGRDEGRIALFEAYAKDNGLWRAEDYAPIYPDTLSLDMGTVVPAISAPKRPQDFIALSEGKAGWQSGRRRLHLGAGRATDLHLRGLNGASGQWHTTCGFGGEQNGAGSSRDWAAKGTALLGVKAVISESFERIHRSNLVGMGVIPFEFTKGDNRNSLGLSGEETVSIHGLDAIEPLQEVPCSITKADGTVLAITLKCRIDTAPEIEYIEHGGVLHYVLRNLAQDGVLALISPWPVKGRLSPRGAEDFLSQLLWLNLRLRQPLLV